MRNRRQRAEATWQRHHRLRALLEMLEEKQKRGGSAGLERYIETIQNSVERALVTFLQEV